MAEEAARNDSTTGTGIPSDDSSIFAVQVVRQVNYGPLESKRYFVSAKDQEGEMNFHEITESDLIEANYEKLNA
jgi:hypothetical protein